MIAVENLAVAAGSFSLEGISFAVPGGTYGVLMGRTGSGKTTLLEAICGLRRVTGGTIRLGEREVTRLPPADRGIGLVPQDGALFTHLTVREHLAFGPKVHRWSPNRIADRVATVADWLGITPLLDRGVQGLSGGEGQRVALGRALAIEPAILCLDEPLSALDEFTRDALCDLLIAIQERTRLTVLHITHSRVEAERLADQILVLSDGHLQTHERRAT
ncbi:MAG: ATP-binding cassette domain-containing protein [Verrucomicrobiales bacterium]|nr:ATP-binding cassette domain-containing protein [Verrucomicrobiales bacterium]